MSYSLFQKQRIQIHCRQKNKRRNSSAKEGKRGRPKNDDSRMTRGVRDKMTREKTAQDKNEECHNTILRGKDNPWKTMAKEI